MKMGRKSIFALLIIILCVLLFFSTQRREPLAVYLEEKTDYPVIECVNENGEVDIVVHFQTLEEQELYACYCARQILIYVKEMPRQAGDFPKEVTVRLYNKEVKQLVLRISVKSDPFWETDWKTIRQEQLPEYVDYYYFNEVDRAMDPNTKPKGDRK